MKFSTFLLLILVVPIAAHAQAPIGSRALTKAEIKGVPWPSFERDPGAGFQPDTVALQFLLRNQGFFKTKPDGIFGKNTVRAVKSFQKSKGLVVDGIVASQTLCNLCLRLKRGDRGDAVRALQTILNFHAEGKDKIKVDGVFGFSTETLLRRSQSRLGTKADGIAGAQTWADFLSPEEGDE